MWELEESEDRSADLQAAWATLLLATLADVGVLDVVVSPGSRSTPFLLAALADERLRVHRRLDERSAAFFALGQARVTERPSLLLCTSGSAGAHYLPAVLEASESEVPLLVMTADRPPELVGCGANQTLDQVGLFGRHVRWASDLPVASSSESAWRGLHRTALRAVLETLGTRPGPVHLNVRARKPLEPRGGESSEGAGTELAATLRSRPGPRALRRRLVPDSSLVDALLGDLARAQRPVLVAGPGPLRRCDVANRWVRWAATRGVPLLVEATSQLRSDVEGQREGLDSRIAPPDALLRAGLLSGDTAPDLVVQLGTTPSGSGWERTPVAPKHWVISETGSWLEPRGATTGRIEGDEELVLQRLEDEPAAGSVDRAWQQRLFHARRLAEGALQGLRRDSAFHEGDVVRQAVERLPAGGLLALGNSLAVRLVEQWIPGALPAGVRVWSQRGLSGIDGLLSGFAGAASKTSGPVLGILGDLSFLHDLGGFESLLDLGEGRSLTVLVLDNDGGRIFEQLPIARSLDGPRGLDPWTTPPRLDLGRLASAAGLEVRDVRDSEELGDALEVLGRPGVRVLRALFEAGGAQRSLADLVARLRDGLEDAGVVG